MTFFPPLLPWPFQFHKQHWDPAGRVVRRQHAAPHLPRLFDALGQLEYHPSTLRGIDLVKLRGEGSRFFGCPFFSFSGRFSRNPSLPTDLCRVRPQTADSGPAGAFPFGFFGLVITNNNPP